MPPGQAPGVWIRGFWINGTSRIGSSNDRRQPLVAVHAGGHRRQAGHARADRASVWTWAIVIDKYLAYGRARRQFDKFEQVFWSGQSLEELYRTLSERNNTGLAAIFVSAMREWKKSFERGARSPIGLQMRIDRAMDVTLARESEYLSKPGSARSRRSVRPVRSSVCSVPSSVS